MGKRLIGSVGLKPGTDTGFDLDEKGQIHGYSDQQFALPVGDDNQVLSSLASEASGLKWVTPSGATLELLDVHTATGTESTYTFTEALDFDDYSNFIVIFQGGSTAALALQCVLNGNTSSNHHYTIEYSDGSSISDIYVTGAASLQLASTNIIPGEVGMYAYVDIMCNDIDQKYPFYRSYSRDYSNLRWERHNGTNSGITTGDISSITLKTSTSTWIAGSRMCVYGFKTA